MMKLQRTFTLILTIAVLWLTAAHPAAATKYSDGIYTFELTNQNTAVVTDCSLTDETITVPDFLFGYPVAAIGDYAFLNNGSIKDVTLPASVYSIGRFAFAQDAGLTRVLLPRWCEEISDDAFFNSPNVTIYCYTDTAAHAFAVSHEIPFVLIDAPVPKTDIGTATLTLEAYELPYDGTKHYPAVTVVLDGTVLTPATDYTAAYADHVDAGEATVIVSGIGDYAGAVTAHFMIRDVLGDTDGNGGVEVTDATLIQRLLILMAVPDADRIERVGDIDREGLDILDATIIQRYVGLLPVMYPVGEMMR